MTGTRWSPAPLGARLRYRSLEVCLASSVKAAALAITPIAAALYAPPAPWRYVATASTAIVAGLALRRSLQISVTVADDSVEVVNFWRTTRACWPHVCEISTGKQYSWGRGRAYGCVALVVGDRPKPVLVTATLAGGAKREQLLACLRSHAEQLSIPTHIDPSVLSRHIW